MIRRLLFTLSFQTVLILGGAVPSLAASVKPEFNTVRVAGRNYVNLADFIACYQFKTPPKRNNQTFWLSSKSQTFRFTLNNRESFYNGVRLWLNDSPLEHRSSILLSELDVRKTLDPLIRPWAVPRYPVKTIMIDPGHGGEDKGTRGFRGTQEKIMTLDLAARVERLLRKAGFRTLMTRRRDTYVSLEDRSQLANASEADLFLSLHFNSAKPNQQPRGIETYCLTPAGMTSTGSIRERWGMGKLTEEAGNRFDLNNMLLGYLVQQRLLKVMTETEDRGVRRARFFVIRATEKPSILVEGGFLSNPVEEKRILTSEYRDRLAVAIVEGVKRYSAIVQGARK